MTYDGPLRSGAAPDPDDYIVIGPSFGEYGLPPGMAARIADDIMAEDAAPSSTPLKRPRGNRHLDGYGGRYGGDHS